MTEKDLSSGYDPGEPSQNRAFRPLEERVERAPHGADGPWMARRTQARGFMGHGSAIRALDGVQLGRHVVEPGPLGPFRARRSKKRSSPRRLGGCRRGARESNLALKLGVGSSLAGIYQVLTSVRAGLIVHQGDLCATRPYVRPGKWQGRVAKT